MPAALHRRGVLVLPDFITNAGGVICAAIEHQCGTEKAAFKQIDERIRANIRLVLEDALRKNTLPPLPRWRSPREECSKPLQRGGGADAEAFRVPTGGGFDQCYNAQLVEPTGDGS
jgi:hypothetical protein